MSNLIYKTIGNVNPAGKSKVYMLCHPEDKNTYLEMLCSQILACKDCAIWMDEEEYSSQNLEEKEFELKDMQMVVFAVSRHLFTDAKELDVIITICKNYKIPMFPIVIEEDFSSVLSAFEEKFGSIQYLHLHQNSETEIDYETKLKRHMETLFVTERLHEKIRECFDVRIFLSYRKQDRYEANKLMELIHANDKYKSIAFWYDELLVTSENYDVSIREKISKCDFMMLAVTPNVLVKGNYVLETEVPFARDEANKIILPIEMQASDRVAFEKSYVGLEACINCQNVEGIYQKLEEILGRVGVEKKKKTIEESYYIALAYLDGIDVKPDTIMGANMVYKLAKSGYRNAMQKMFELYKFGKGVEADRIKAIEWKEKVIEDYRVEVSLGNATWDKLWGELWSLGEEYEAIRDLESAMICYMEMLKLVEENANEMSVCNILYTYDLLGDIEFNQQRYRQALQWYGKSEELYLACKKDAENGDFRYLFLAPLLDDIAKIFYQRLGTIYTHLGEFSKARKCFSFYNLTTQNEVNEHETLKRKRESLLSYTNEAFLCMNTGEFSKATSLYDTAYKLCEELSQYAEDEEILRYKAAILQSWSIVECSLEKMSSADEKMKQAIVTAIKIVENYGVESIFDFMIQSVQGLVGYNNHYANLKADYNVLHQIYVVCEKIIGLNLKNEGKARTIMLQAALCDLAQIYAQKSGEKRVWNLYGVSMGILGDLYMDIDLNEAKACYYEELKAYELLFEYDNSRYMYENIGCAQFSIAKCAVGDERRLRLGYAADIYSNLFAKYPEDSKLREVIMEIATFIKEE